MGIFLFILNVVYALSISIMGVIEIGTKFGMWWSLIAVLIYFFINMPAVLVIGAYFFLMGTFHLHPIVGLLLLFPMSEKWLREQAKKHF